MNGAGRRRVTAGCWCRIVVASARMQVLAIRTHPAVPLTAVVQPAVLWLIAGLHGVEQSSSGRLETLVAILLTSLWGSSLWGAGGILRREIGEGTLGRNLTSATDPRLVIVGKCLGSTVLVLGILLCTGTALALAAGASVPLASLPWLAAGFALVAVSGTVMGFALSAVFVLTRHAVHVTALLSYPVYILGGLILPLGMLPAALHWPSRLVSLYWADRFLAPATRGTVPSLIPALCLIGVTAGYYLTGHLLFAAVVRRARVKGTLDVG